MDNDPVSLEKDPVSAVWLGVLYGLYPFIGVPINVLLVITILKTESVRSVPINICILNLAFIDTCGLMSFFSSPFWALTYNVMICKIAGPPIYAFAVLSMMLPACLAVCRHAATCSVHELHPILRPLKKRWGIILLNSLFLLYGAVFTLPWIIYDKFGLDGMGFCGVTDHNSFFLKFYYVWFVFVVFLAYGVAFFFYRKLAHWVKMTSSLMEMTPQTKDTLMATRNLMMMLKWILVQPFIVVYPALIADTFLHIFPGYISVRTGRIFMSTVPLPHIFNPVVTFVFVKRYRVAARAVLTNIFVRQPSLVHPTAAEAWALQSVRRSVDPREARY